MILRKFLHWATGIDVIDAVRRAEHDRDNAKAATARISQWHHKATAERDALAAERDEAAADVKRLWTERDAARDQADAMAAELQKLRRDNAILRSLVRILRERLETVDNGPPDRCTKTDPTEPQTEPADRLAGWERHGSHRWGLGVAHDLHFLERRVAALEGRP